MNGQGKSEAVRSVPEDTRSEDTRARTAPAPPVLCIGSAMWDVIGTTDERLDAAPDVPGRVVMRPGGVAANIAIALAARGLRPALRTAFGDDEESRVLEMRLVAAGVDTRLALRLPGRRADRYMAIEAAGRLVAAIADAATLEAAGAALVAPLFAETPPLAPGPDGRVIVLVDGNLPAPVLARLARGRLAPWCDLRLVPASPGKVDRLAPFLAGHSGPNRSPGPSRIDETAAEGHPSANGRAPARQPPAAGREDAAPSSAQGDQRRERTWPGQDDPAPVPCARRTAERHATATRSAPAHPSSAEAGAPDSTPLTQDMSSGSPGTTSAFPLRSAPEPRPLCAPSGTPPAPPDDPPSSADIAAAKEGPAPDISSPGPASAAPGAGSAPTGKAETESSATRGPMTTGPTIYLNRHEAEILLGRRLADAAAAARALVACGLARAIVTDGPATVADLATGEAMPLTVTPPRITPRQVTGAGDCFIAAHVAAEIAAASAPFPERACDDPLPARLSAPLPTVAGAGCFRQTLHRNRNREVADDNNSTRPRSSPTGDGRIPASTKSGGGVPEGPLPGGGKERSATAVPENASAHLPVGEALSTPPSAPGSDHGPVVTFPPVPATSNKDNESPSSAPAGAPARHEDADPAGHPPCVPATTSVAHKGPARRNPSSSYAEPAIDTCRRAPFAEPSSMSPASMSPGPSESHPGPFFRNQPSPRLPTAAATKHRAPSQRPPEPPDAAAEGSPSLRPETALAKDAETPPPETPPSFKSLSPGAPRATGSPEAGPVHRSHACRARMPNPEAARPAPSDEAAPLSRDRALSGSALPSRALRAHALRAACEAAAAHVAGHATGPEDAPA